MRALAPRLLALTLLLCACRAAAPRPPAVAAPPPLPGVFGPVGWDSTAASLRARFPEAQVFEDEDEVRASGARLEPFGTVEIRLMRYAGRPTGVLVIQREEDRGACFPQGATQDFMDTCVERLDRERRAVYDAVAAPLMARHGPGTLGHLESEALLTEADPVQLEQSVRHWALPGLDLELAMGLDPRYHHTEMVRLAAIRDREVRFW
jgi:hypothetical protein